MSYSVIFCLWRLNKDLKYPKAARLSKRRPWFPTQDFPSSVFPTTDGSRLIYMIEITATGNAKSAPETTVCLVVSEFLYFTVWGLQKTSDTCVLNDARSHFFLYSCRDFSRFGGFVGLVWGEICLTSYASQFRLTAREKSGKSRHI